VKLAAYLAGLFGVALFTAVVIHSDVAGLPLVSAQNIEDKDRKYVYFACQLSSDGKRLTLRRVSTDVIPKAITDSATIARQIEKSRDNPQLFQELLEYTRVP